ncbi:MAG TPA: AAA family ATPase [Candidatus Paceibacterota bacterium]|nr:AAA family ATPase [Candidatus Paceibacterota bacterium]
MTLAIIGIGIPGSGKTTVLKPFADRTGFAYVNRDDIREELLGDAEDQSHNRLIWEEANLRTKEAVERGESVVLDSAFVDAWKREHMIAYLRELGIATVIGAYADVPLAVAKERNEARERVVPEYVLDAMHAKLAAAPPSLDEGFDALVPLDEIERLGDRIS